MYASLKNIVVFLALSLVWGSAFAQSEKQTVNEKPKIGLVLSGGGAKGLAHIGVLKVLEEVGIRPDYITGTSMGSIVGSLYAAGYSAEELTEINNNAAWNILLTDSEQLLKVALDEKSETEKYLFELPIKDKKMNLPAGLIEGQHLENYFSRLFWPLTSTEDFNQLPIPFHCMSVDMVSGKTIEHTSGNLTKSIRASMSIPTVFSPVVMDSMLLVDGGVTRNFPVQEVINMGADIVIGVYVGFEGDIKKEDIGSMTDILQRSIALAGIVDAKAQLSKVDILITPDLGDLGAGDFMQGKVIQELGEKSAREHYSQLKALADSLNLSFEPVTKVVNTADIKISKVDVDGLVYLDKDYVLSKSGIEAGDLISQDKLDEAIEFMYGTRYFRKLTYSLKKDDDDTFMLTFHVKENDRAMFKFTPYYDDDLGVGLVVNFTLRNIIERSSRLLFTANLGENPGVLLRYSSLFGNNQHFGNEIYFTNDYYNLPFYVDGERLGQYRRNYLEWGYGIHYSPGLNHKLGGDIFYKYNNLSPRADLRTIYQEADFNRLRTKEWGYRFFYRINSTDDLYFPTRGIKVNLQADHMFNTKEKMDLNSINSAKYFIEENDDPYFTLIAEYDGYRTIAKTLTWGVGFDVGLNIEHSSMNGLFALGGTQFGNRTHYRDLAGYNFAEAYVANYAVLRSNLRLKLGSGLFLNGTVNVANMADDYEQIFEDFTDKALHNYFWGYNVGIQYKSLLGPIQFLISDNNKDSDLRFHFSVGFPF